MNREVGFKIRKARMALGLSQMTLAGRIEVSYQQVQKYETGANKVSLEKLEKISRALNVPISYFIGGIEKKTYKKESIVFEKKEEYGKLDLDDLSEDELSLVLRFRSIRNRDIKKGIIMLVGGVNEAEGV